MKWFLLALATHSLVVAQGMSCLQCDRDLCKDETCLGSKVLDPCGCCEVCMKQEKETCGGPWGRDGTCDNGLACASPMIILNFKRTLVGPPQVNMGNQTTGVCIPHSKECNEVCAEMSHKKLVPAGFSFNGGEGLFKNRVTGSGYRAYCDCSPGPGMAWMVIQRRSSSQENFNRTWSEYVRGFGSRTGDHWLGLNNIHRVTNSKPHELEILVSYGGYALRSRYRILHVGDQSTGYKLTVGFNSGERSNQFVQIHNGMQFSTKDKDNDNWMRGECAKWYGGGWWFNSCTDQNLNGVFYAGTPQSPGPDEISWAACCYGAVTMVEMRVRPVQV